MAMLGLRVRQLLLCRPWCGWLRPKICFWQVGQSSGSVVREVPCREAARWDGMWHGQPCALLLLRTGAQTQSAQLSAHGDQLLFLGRKLTVSNLLLCFKTDQILPTFVLQVFPFSPQPPLPFLWHLHCHQHWPQDLPLPPAQVWGCWPAFRLVICP